MKLSRAKSRLVKALALGVTLAGAFMSKALCQETEKASPETKPPTMTQTASSTPEDTNAKHSPTPYWIAHSKELLVDFGNLQHFKAADAGLPAQTPGENRIVFMGDSITQGWNLETSFPGKPYINRGISGETTPQMLVRFRQDVVDLHPRVVVILAGTNDLAGNTGPMTIEETEENLASMADLASANNIHVVLCSVTPSVNFPWLPGLQPAPKIVSLNDWIRVYAKGKHYIYVDYYSALKDTDGGLPPSLSRDGVHPNPAGYAIMAPLVEAGIERALKERN